MQDRPDSFMPLYIGDYLADTAHLNAEEHGSYLLLLMHYWRAGGPITSDDVQLARVTRCTVKDWTRVKSAVLAFFKIEDGRLVHGRVEHELKRAAEQYQAKVERAKAGAAKRWGKQSSSNQDASAQDMPEQCLSIPQAVLDQCQPQPQPQSLTSPLSGRKLETTRSRAGSPKAPASPAASSEGPTDTRWEQGFPKWLKVRQTFGDTLWLSTFGCCRPNGSETSIIAPSKFWAEKLDTQFSDKLERVFGEPVTFKFQEEAKP
jgi:uncharacterized protein YdaU (DUF1376 family)